MVDTRQLYLSAGVSGAPDDSNLIAQLAQLGLAREVGGRQLAVAFLQLLLHAADVQFSGLLLH